jgi:hypothetical protein
MTLQTPLLPFLLSFFLLPGALAQTATAITNQTGQIVNKNPVPPAKPPVTPPKKATSPAKPAGPSSSNSNSNLLQNQSSNANANRATGTGTGIGVGGAGGTGTAGATANGGSNSGSTNGTVDASDHAVSNTNVRVNYIPAVIPETPPSFLAVGNVAVESSGCGPLQQVEQTPVNGTFFGLMKKSKVSQGFTDELEPYTNASGELQAYYKAPDGNGGSILYGHQVTQYTAILGVSGAKNIALGGGAGGGSWGQAGLGASSSNQQLVTKIVLRLCEAGRIEPPTPSVPLTTNEQDTWTYGSIIGTLPTPDVPTETKKIRQ